MFGFLKKKPHTIHLDYAAGTPVHPEVLCAMLPYFSEEWANPSAIYQSGVRARRAVEDSRTRMARLLHVRPGGIIFVSGGTEANYLAVHGLLEKLFHDDRKLEECEIITTKIEHAATLTTCDVLRARGVTVKYVELESDGRMKLASLRELLTTKTVLVTVSYVNSEIGTIEDVKGITREVGKFNREHGTNILVHLDAAQAPLWLPCALDSLGVDLMSLDSGKCYGPKGMGVLALRHGVTISPVMKGGGQERGLRGGTENVPLIVGGTLAFARAQESYVSRSERVATLRDRMIDLLVEHIPGVTINGSREHRVANNVHVSIPGIDGEYAVVTLDHHGIATSTRSACGAQGGAGSAVIRELTQSEEHATSTIRFTLGEETTKADIKTAVSVLKTHVEKMRGFHTRTKM